jgi:ligand-binding sensor domain-containing protein
VLTEVGGAKDIAVNEKGQIWVVTSYSLMVFDGQSWTYHQPPHGVYSLEAIAIDSVGRVWIGYYGGVSVLLDDGQWLNYSSNEFGLGEYAGLINDIAIDHQDQVWVATSSGIAVFNGNNWTPYDESSGLTYDTIEAVVVDNQGQVWVAHSFGVDVFDGINWILYGNSYLEKVPQIEVEELYSVQALAVDKQGFVWAGTNSYGVSVFNGDDWQTYGSKECLYGSSVNSITCDNQGRIWVGTDFGLAVFDGSNWLQYTSNKTALCSNDITAIFVNGTGPLSLPPAPILDNGGATGTITINGQKVAGVLVVLCWEVEMFYSGESPIRGDSYSTFTDTIGSFYIDDIPPNRYILAVKTPEGKWYFSLSSFRILEGETTLIPEFSI